MRFIGVDAHKSFFQVTELGENGSQTDYRVDLDPEGLADFKRRLGPDAYLVLEASGSTFRLYDELAPHAASVIVANPAQTRGASAYHVKTDRRDAAILARLLASGFISSVWVPGPAVRALRHLVEYRHSLVQMRTATINRLRALLHQDFIRLPGERLVTKSGWESLLKTEFSHPHFKLNANSLVNLYGSIVLEQQKVDAALKQWARESEDARLLLTIPGIGPVVAASLMAEIGEVSRFPSAAELCSYAGLVPKVLQSGNTRWTGGISRAGRRALRGLLANATWRTVRRPGPVRDFFERLVLRRPRMVAFVATCRKLLAIIWHMLRNKAPYKSNDPALTMKKLRRLSHRGPGSGRSTLPPKS